MMRRVGPGTAARSQFTATRRMLRRMRPAGWCGPSRSRRRTFTTESCWRRCCRKSPARSTRTASAGRFTDVIRAHGGVPRVVYTSTWGGPAALARLEAWNAEVGAVRGRIEKVFGTWKRSYGLRRMRWLGLAKAGLQVRLTAIAYNLRRSATILRARGI